MLQKCMITLDPSQLHHLLDRLGEGHDQVVLEWQDELLKQLDPHNVSVLADIYV